MSTGQINLLDEIIVDNFAGGGGASTGIELATGRVVDIAINHDPDAILMHRTNHPHTTHYQASVWDVDPVEVCRGRKVGLAWFSPDCKHFSKAKGGKPVDKNIRGLAWIVLRWAGTVRPRVIILENVEEFQTWGPVRKGKPVKKLTGQTFRKWLDQLRNLGYAVEWRELVAADYGAPTTRKRFFLIARCDGRPIVWPTPTHAPADSPEVKAGLRQPWRSAAEIIDWSLPKEAHPDIRQIAQDALDQVEALTHTISTIPTQNGSLTYTGSPQSPSWNGYDPTTLTLGGTTEATDAGTYTATFTPKDDYQWADGTKEAKSVQWSIGRANIASVPTQTGSLTYNGSAQSPTWSGYDASKMTLGGTTSGTNAGSYAATFTPKANYQWTDGTTAAKEAPWTIGRATVSTLPSQSGSLTYTGSAQSPTWANYDTTKLTIGGATSGTNAGTYTATFTPTSNYQWDGGGVGPQSVNWSIGKAAGSLTLNRSSLTLNNATRTGTITVTRPGNGAVTASSNNTGIATVSVSGTTITVTAVAYGSATITVKVAEGTNYTAPSSKTCSVTVNLFNATLNSNTWAAIKAASDAGDAANVWSVGDTKSIRINGKVGNFTFSNQSIDAFIVGFNHNSGKEGGQRTHFAIGKISGKMVALCDNQYRNEQTSSGYFNMNTSRSNVGGWNSTNMRRNILGNTGTPTSPPANTLLAALPSDLRAVMKSVTKYTDNTGNGSNVAGNVTATTDYLWLFAEFEVFGARYYANQYEQNSQAQYVYFSAGNSRVAYKHSSTGTAVWWWLRSANYYASDYFCSVYTDGGYYLGNASWSAGVLAGLAA